MKTNYTTQSGNQEGLLIMEGKYVRYNILGDNFELLTINGWIRVVTVDWSNNDHLNAEYVHGIKLSDAHINALMTKEHEYNIMCTVDAWRPPFNQWQAWPHTMYVHNSIERFSSVDPANSIANANLVSTTLDASPVSTDLKYDGSTIGFGFAAGDTFYGYGARDKLGFTQHFSGPGRGAVYVR